jgi:L-asparaginase/Glu-tRNA(Gln) amidotransferase subunit D
MAVLESLAMIANPVWVALLAAFSNAYALPKVVVFATGGTISGKYDPAKGGYLPVLSGSDLVAAVPKLKEIAEIQVEQVNAINSYKGRSNNRPRSAR